MPMPGPAVWWETINNNIGSELTNCPHGIMQNLLFIPNPEGFFWGFGVAKIISPGKKLLTAIDPASGK